MNILIFKISRNMKEIMVACISLIISHTVIGQSVSAENLFNCYWQDSANNCASIAMIKANLNAFGLDGIFQRSRVNDSTMSYLLKDETVVTVTNNELSLARNMFNADTSNCNTPECAAILHVSFECYAIMAKRFHDEFPWFKSANYENAITYISDTSFDIRYGTNLLGTEAYFFVPKFWYAGIVGKKGAIVWSGHHTVFASDYKCDMRGNSSNFRKGSKSYLRFHGRMWIEPKRKITNRSLNKVS